MKKRVLSIALTGGLAGLLTGCAAAAPDIAPPVNEPLSASSIFQADTAQTADHIAQCVYQAYQGRDGVALAYQTGGGRAVIASLAFGLKSPIEVIQFTPTASGAHIEIHQVASLARDPMGFIKAARVCGAMSGS